jgi:type IV fimbrial biogenesis protein FimT
MTSHTRHPMKHQRGFSIIELAVTLVVLGILLTSALPNITSWIRNAKLRTQADTLQAGLQQARNEAVKRNRPVSFWLVSLPTANSMDNQCTVASSGTSWVVSVSSPASLCASAVSASSAPMIAAKRVGADGSTGVTVSGLQADGSTAASSVTFDGFGRASGNLSRIDVSYTSAEHTLSVRITPAGMVRLCDMSAASGDPRSCS